MDNQIDLYKNAASYLYGVKKSRLNSLIRKSGSLQTIFESPINELAKRIGVPERQLNSMEIPGALKHARKNLYFNKKHKISNLFFKEETYPSQLKECTDGPISLNVLGPLKFKNKRIVSVVGSRKCSHHAKEMTQQLISSFQGSEVIVLSGLASGVDTFVHESCLKYNVNTAAILGHGLQMIYPSKNRILAKKILDSGGALISEFDYQKKPNKYSFPQRNRIIAGMSDVTVIIESGIKGGGMITAELANNYAREVMAFPNAIRDVSYGGCNELIKKNKAHLITEANDLFELMNWEINRQNEYPLELSNNEREIVKAIQQRNDIHIDELIQNSKLGVGHLQSMLVELELKNIIASSPSLCYSIKS